MAVTHISSPEDSEFDAFLAYLADAHGFDFTAYKRTTLRRRVQKRMDATGVPDVGAYRDLLEVRPAEFRHLVNAILINVTGFFRDAPVWDHLRDEVLPGMLRRGIPSGGLRVWSAGCASGEEAYTVAMLLADAMGRGEFRQHVRLYATDVDEEALAEARLASYSETQLAAVPPDSRARYFTPANGRFLFDRELQGAVIVVHHDLLQDAPISQVSLLTCRNTVMYFNAEAQTRIAERLAFALVPGGVLVLGKAEMLLGRSPVLQPIDIKRRIFAKVGSAT